MADKTPKLHGNHAKIDPKKKITGDYITNAVTLFQKKEGETPVADDEAVDLAREFSQENQK